jgi:hypothetical protein
MNYLEESTHACTLCDNEEQHLTCQTILAPTSVSAKSLTKYLHALRAGTLYCLMWNKRHDGSHPFLFEPRRRPPFRTAKGAAWKPIVTFRLVRPNHQPPRPSPTCTHRYPTQSRQDKCLSVRSVVLLRRTIAWCVVCRGPSGDDAGSRHSGRLPCLRRKGHEV